jgi:DNA-binding transcriptional LysR family regulator
MEFRQLYYFVQIVNEKSFTKASLKLHVTQSALSKMIRHLEDDIGCELLKRTNREVHLTDIGSTLYEKSKKLSVQFDDICNYVNNIANTEEGTISVGIPPVIGTCLFPRILPQFQEKYPKINLNIVEEGANTVYQKVLNETLDVGIVIRPVDENEFDIYPVIEDDIALAVHKEHHLAGKRSVKVVEVANENFVLLNDTFMLYHNIISACSKAGFQPKIMMQSANWDFLLAMVSGKQGVTMLPSPICKKFNNKNIRIIPITDELLKWSIVIITKKFKLMPSVENIFIDFTQKNACFHDAFNM